MAENQTPTQPRSTAGRILFAAIVLILLSVVGFYLLFPFLGIAIVMSTGAWGMVVGTVVLFSIAALLFFVIPGLLIFLIALFAFGWLLWAIILFPFLFPILLPVFIILLVVALLRKK